eukprot:5756924-Pleurochrysis_carterae.AAC.2
MHWSWFSRDDHDSWGKILDACMRPPQIITGSCDELVNTFTVSAVYVAEICKPCNESARQF